MTQTQTLLHEAPSTPAAMQNAASLSAHLPQLETVRLILRAPRLEDFDAYAQIACSPRGKGLGGPFERSDAWYDFATMVGTWLLRGHGLWSVDLAKTSDLLGFVVIGFEPGDRNHELGYMMLESSEGQGYAAEAAEAARRYAQDVLKVPVLDSYIFPENDRSIALAQRLDAQHVGQISYPEDDDPSLIYRYPNPVNA